MIISQFSKRSNTMTENNLNVAVIGCSRIMGRIHMTGVSKMEGATLYAICDTADDGRLEEAKEMFNVPIAVTDYRVLVDDPNIDIAVIVDHLNDNYFEDTPLLWKLRRKISNLIEPVLLTEDMNNPLYCDITKTGILI
jgi:hypothetical protein